MFIEFQIGNFRSFRDLQKFSLQASPLRSNDNGLNEDHVFESAGIRLLRSKAVVGANGSGKSNLAKAIGIFVNMISNSVSHEGMAGLIWQNRYQLITDWEEEPVFFELTFIHQDKPFRYGFQILKNKVIYEWLFEATLNGGEYFTREGQNLTVSESRFIASKLFYNQVETDPSELFREDALFLTAAALSGNKFSSGIRQTLLSMMIIDGVNDQKGINYALQIIEGRSSWQKEGIKELLRSADTGVEDLKIQEFKVYSGKHIKDIENKPVDDKSIVRGLFSRHSVYNHDGQITNTIFVPFGTWESEGTEKLFGLGALMLESLNSGTPVIIDELDARMHPNLTLKIVELYNNEETNPHNSQLIFITHDTGLLRRGKLRRDQIALVDKDKYGMSTIRTLIEYKGVRKDASYEKEYLQGSYNAVPFLDDFDDLITHKLHEDE
ncbi:AAA family ATPase [Niabella aquatica]